MKTIMKTSVGVRTCTSSDGKPDYGIDAPIVVRNLSIAGILMFMLSMAFFWLLRGRQWWLGGLLGGIFGLTFLISLVEAVYMLWSSKVGKLRERERLLDLVDIRGDEKVLDVGCGRGLVLNAAARRLTTGKAIGIDIWNRQDQSGNHPDVTRKNAEAEGVLEKVEIIDGDARDLPFANDVFDIVVSSLAIHNIYNRKERYKSLSEILRVLKPGGRVAILDFWHVKEYADVFEALGLTDVKMIGPHYLMFPPVRIVTARKP
jgi:SAM-dependent methyltransferase